jgi:hypothetical protein
MDACYGAGSLAVDSAVMGGMFVAGRQRGVRLERVAREL